MKPLALLLLLLTGGAPLLGDEAQAKDTRTGLVEAAKESKAKRKKSTAKVLTNADVKKSKGKVITTPNVSEQPVKPEPTLLEKHAAEKAAEKALAEKRQASDRLIAGLEKELARIELSYFDENDPDRRDREIAKRFDEVKARLDAARAARP